MFDPANKIVALCAEGMDKEASYSEEAARLFLQAWEEASNDFEKATAAHYVARHQPTPADKLAWDKTALHHALAVEDESIRGTYPSLYLNIAKGYEDIGDYTSAAEHYRLAQNHAASLPADGYGAMIKQGIANGLERVTQRSELTR